MINVHQPLEKDCGSGNSRLMEIEEMLLLKLTIVQLTLPQVSIL